MDTLNLECLEHIVKFLDGPSEWLELSKVSPKFEDVVTKCWKKITKIELVDIGNVEPDVRFLQDKKVKEIVKFASGQITEIKLTKRTIINYITLAGRRYSVYGLTQQAVLELVENHCAEKLEKASILADDRCMLRYLMKTKKELKELELSYDENNFADSQPVCCSIDEIDLLLRTLTFNPYYVDYKQILDSFPLMEKFIITFRSLSEKKLHKPHTVLDDILYSLPEWRRSKVKVDRSITKLPTENTYSAKLELVLPLDNKLD